MAKAKRLRRGSKKNPAKMMKAVIIATAEEKLQQAKGHLYDYRDAQRPNATHTPLRRAVAGFLNAAQGAVGIVAKRDKGWFEPWKAKLTPEDSRLLELLRERRNEEEHDKGVTLAPDHTLIPASEVGGRPESRHGVVPRPFLYDYYYPGHSAEARIGVRSRLVQREQMWSKSLLR